MFRAIRNNLRCVALIELFMDLSHLLKRLKHTSYFTKWKNRYMEM